MNSARTTLYVGKNLLNCSIIKGMNMEQVTGILAEAIELVYNNQSLDCIDLSKYGVTCPPEDRGKLLCFILEMVLKDQVTLANRISQLNNFNSNVQQSVGTITDEKVKVSKGSAASKYLEEAIIGTAGKVKVLGDKIVISGLTPIGARMTVNPTRKGDFDATGKGKPGTDLEGWAIRNGQNGTDNALGRFVMYTDTLETAGKKAGSNTFTVKMANIESFTLSVTGSINESLSDPVKASIPWQAATKCFGISGCRKVVIPDLPAPDRRESDALNLKHTHSHTLTVAHNNATPQSISVIPEHIKEIPIEYVG